MIGHPQVIHFTSPKSTNLSLSALSPMQAHSNRNSACFNVVSALKSIALVQPHPLSTRGRQSVARLSTSFAKLCCVLHARAKVPPFRPPSVRPQHKPRRPRPSSHTLTRAARATSPPSSLACTFRRCSVHQTDPYKSDSRPIRTLLISFDSHCLSQKTSPLSPSNFK
jgi:hypothetical protein